MKPVTLILPYYMNPGMLDIQIQNIESWPKAVRDQWRVIIVDDGSPEPAVIPTHLNFSCRLYRITVDVRWNWLAARNIGVHEAGTDWVMMTDIDHLLPVETAAKLNVLDHDGRDVYRFSRVSAPDLSPYKPHPNSWFMRKKMFDAVGGYDERFSGWYGTDCIFRDKLALRARQIVILDDPLIRYGREVQDDASTTTYDRKTPADRENVQRIRKIVEFDPTPKRLSFPWVRVA